MYLVVDDLVVFVLQEFCGSSAYVRISVRYVVRLLLLEAYFRTYLQLFVNFYDLVCVGECAVNPC